MAEESEESVDLAQWIADIESRFRRQVQEASATAKEKAGKTKNRAKWRIKAQFPPLRPKTRGRFVCEIDSFSPSLNTRGFEAMDVYIDATTVVVHTTPRTLTEGAGGTAGS